MTQPNLRNYPERRPNIFGGVDWHYPMYEEDSISVPMLLEYLKITDPENATSVKAYQLMAKLHKEHKAYDKAVGTKLSNIIGPAADRNRAYARLAFQKRQWQAADLFAEAYKTADSNPAKLVPMAWHHFPKIERAHVNDAVMKETVQEALKTLRQAHSPAAVEKLWLELNQEVDQISETAKAMHMVRWSEDPNAIPPTPEDMENIWTQDQREAAWTVIDQHLTEPINALMEAEDEADSGNYEEF